MRASISSAAVATAADLRQLRALAAARAAGSSAKRSRFFRNFVFHASNLIFTRIWWRPRIWFACDSLPISSASFNATKSCGDRQSTLALLCLRTSNATSLFQHRPARIPWCLLAVIATPFADPQINMPGRLRCSPQPMQQDARKSQDRSTESAEYAPKSFYGKLFRFEPLFNAFFVIEACMIINNCNGL